MPELRLTGNWFEQLGFSIGDRVRITTREKLLIIQPVKDHEIRQIKEQLSIKQVLDHYGLKPRNKMLNYPFHEDKIPSMQVYPETNTVFCFSIRTYNLLL